MRCTKYTILEGKDSKQNQSLTRGKLLPVSALETKPATQSWTCMILLLEILYFPTSTAMELTLSESVHLRAKEGGIPCIGRYVTKQIITRYVRKAAIIDNKVSIKLHPNVLNYLAYTI